VPQSHTFNYVTVLLHDGDNEIAEYDTSSTLMVTEMIQTSALIVETEATRVNTEILRQIAYYWYLAR
jgi:hypothetical protein